jgi:capsular exopolysaccharide synthesis family protein
MENNDSPALISNDFRFYLQITIKWLWLILFCALLAGGAAYITNRISIPIYQSSTRLLINESLAAKSNDYNAILSGERQARTYAEMLTNRPLLDSVISELGLNLTPEKLVQDVTVELVRDTRLIDISVESQKPDQAAAIANLIAENFIVQIDTLENVRYEESMVGLEKQIAAVNEQIQSVSADLTARAKKIDTVERDRLEANLAQYRQTYSGLVQSYEAIRQTEATNTSSVAQFEPAVPSTKPIRPQVLLNTALGALAGAFVGIFAVFLIEVLDDTIRTVEDINRHLGMPIFGQIPTHKIGDQKPITLSQPLSPASNAYRVLRANIHFASVDKPIKKLLITSSNPQEGKTELITNLGIILAQNDFQTVIIDSDFRRPAVHQRLGLSNHHGLSSLFIEKQIDLNVSFQTIDTPNLKILAAGSLPPNPTELLASAKMAQIIETISEQVDMLLVDTPPMLAVADAAVISPRVDGVLLVIRPGVTKIADARHSIEQLKRAKANILGVVLNGIDIRHKGYYNGYYADNKSSNGADQNQSGLFQMFRKRKAK